VNGTTAPITVTIAQTTTGELFLAPPSSAAGAIPALTAQPIISIRINALAAGSNTNNSAFALNRQLLGFDNGTITGTAGNDLINNSYVEPVGNGSDVIDGGDADRPGNGL
jgi:hypothetical protein